MQVSSIAHPHQEMSEKFTASSQFSPQFSNGSTTTTTTTAQPQFPIRIQQQSQIPISRSDPNNPYPTTFVTADTSSFKQVVQMLTGSDSPKPLTHSQIEHHHPTPHSSSSSSSSKNFVIPPIRTAHNKKQQQGFKLYERRNSLLKSSFMISPLTPNNNSAQNASFSPRNGSGKAPEMLSPSILDFPSLTLSPVTPLAPAAAGGEDQFDRSSTDEEEVRAIAEKGFYFHPSPRDGAEPPQLLPLFPVTSPRFTELSSSSTTSAS